MNSVHVHLMTAHLPVVGVPFAIALLVAGLIRKSQTLWRAGCWSLLFSACLTAFPYFSGPPAYERVAEAYELPRDTIERHAVVARGTSLGLVLLGALTLSSLLRDWQGDPPGKPLKTVVLAGAVFAAYALAWSAHLGGLVRHPELAEPALRAFPSLDS
jgi:uncharacterized membrane protein